MFSLQKFFGKDDQFLDLLEASAEECTASVSALKHILVPGAKLSLDEFVVSRRKDKQITNDIRELLCKTSVTGLEREDIESIANSLYKIPKRSRNSLSVTFSLLSICKTSSGMNKCNCWSKPPE